MGPLDGIRIIELAGIGPGPFAGMMLADMGADVIRIERPGGNPSANVGHDVLFRSRRSIAVDLKHPDGVETILRLCEASDGLFEGYRPGVAERLGVGPDVCLARNPALVYGRMTGWGQDGPLADRAGHDINYIALSGTLHAIGRVDSGPVPPLNLAGDFGGGGMMMAYGMVCGLLSARMAGAGQVIDVSMVEGSAALMAMFYDMRARGIHRDTRGTNLLDTGAPFYDVYETSDGQWLALGAIEPQFFAQLCDLLDADDTIRAAQGDFAGWPQQKEAVARVIATRTRAEWEERFAGSDACVAPVLSLGEAPQHPHNVARGSFVEVDGIVQHRPTPRFSATPAGAPTPASRPGTHTAAVLADCGFAPQEIADLIDAGAVTQL